MIKIMIGENEAGQRTDRFLRKYLSSAPLSAVYRIIRKDLKVNGKRVREDTQLSAGDELTLYLTQEQLDAYAAKARRRAPAKKQFRVIYEDAQVLIVSKPAGLLVHGDQTEKRNTLINQVCGYLQEKGEYDPSRETTFTPSPANRIDRNTSGLVIFGKTAPALRELTRLIRTRDGIRKFYLAVAAGMITEEMILTDRLTKDTEKNRVSVAMPADTDYAAGEQAGAATNIADKRPNISANAQGERAGALANAPDISTDTPDLPTVASGEQAGASNAPRLPGQAAQTHVRPVETGERFSLVEAELITGRTHQIRVHLAEAGHPLAGDPKYGDPRVNEVCRKKHITSQLLHAWRLQFAQMNQPLQELSGKTIEAEPPKAFRQAAEELIHGGI